MAIRKREPSMTNMVRSGERLSISKALTVEVRLVEIHSADSTSVASKEEVDSRRSSRICSDVKVSKVEALADSKVSVVDRLVRIAAR